MVALRSGAQSKLWASCGLAALVFFGNAGRIGPQDLARSATAQPAAERFRERVTGALSVLRVAGFDLPRPLGTHVPSPEAQRVAAYVPKAGAALVNRGSKGDLLVPRIQVELTAELLQEDARGDAAEADEIEAAQRFAPFPEYDVSVSLELHPRVPATPAASGTDPDDLNQEFSAARLYFGAAPVGATLAAIEPWKDDEAPAVSSFVSVRPDAQAANDDSRGLDAIPPVVVAAVSPSEALRSISPAQRLRLEGPARAKAEKCLANAIYFESRSEPVRGQIAVAQVVLNRTFSGYYPNDICGVVYQGSHRHLSCQFTFACDGIPDVVTEQTQWDRAVRIAKAALDGKIWLPDVGRATHYHASYVYPYWVRSMRRLQKIGLHSFYRPRRWGDGADAPSWGHGTATAEVAARF
jgi:hypothetical protein